ncbi:MAG: hypothetical protein IT328_04585 [Caldilineaceae bacterium]|nr:hypothetical protein [Caldilineaceae bacterium]
MALLGARALIDRVIGTGLDASEILKFQMRDGRTAQEIVLEAAAMIGDVNEELSRIYGGLWFMTERDYARYANGESARSATPRKAEFKRADGVRASMIGHMLPLHDNEDAVEWTKLYLRDAYSEDITADLQLITDRWRNRVDQDAITRALTNTENPIGSAGYDVGWAIGTGVNVNYIPPQYGATVFDSSHSHYVVKDSATQDYDDLVEAMMAELRHHGHMGTLTLLVSQTDVGEYAAFQTAGLYVPLTPPGIQVISGNSNSPVFTASGEINGIPGELIGYWKSPTYGLAEIRSHARIPSGYAYMTKSYGVNNARNGLALRTHPAQGFGLRVDPQVTRSINPELEFILFDGTHGVGVNDRINGVAGYIANGASTWVNPAIN